jgi:HSP20 family protein
MVDVFEEEDQTLVVAEMPGVVAEDIRLDFRDHILTLSAERGQKRYRKEVLLSGDFDPGQVTVSCHNGVAEVRCLKPTSARDLPGQGPRRQRSSSG